MNREQRRRGGTHRQEGINWAKEPPDHCPTATKVIAAIREGRDGWIVQTDPCARCKLHTVVARLDDMVYACLACGSHGTLGTPDDKGKMVLH